MTEPRRVRSLVGVYDADGTLGGELRYWVGARLGRVHCELCVISHGLFRRKHDWDEFVARCAVPFETFHRDDAPTEVSAALDALAAVAALTDDGVIPLLGPAELEECAGDVAAFAVALDGSLVARGFEAVSAPATASPD